MNNREIEITRKYYEKNVDRWASIKTNSFHHEKQFRKFIDYFKKSNSILDIGCAYGIHVPLFLGIGRHLKYEGIDISKKMFTLARSRYPQLSFKYGNVANKKTLPKKKYNGFWAAAILMHIPFKDWNKMFDNIESIMKKGAIGYITIPSERPSPPSKKDQRHFSIVNKKDFRKLLTNRGWKILNSGKLDGSSKNNIWSWFIIELP